MKKHIYKSALSVALCIHWLIPQASLFAQSAKKMSQIGRYKTEDSGRFSGIFSIFQAKMSPADLENSPRIESLIHDGNSNSDSPMRWRWLWKITWTWPCSAISLSFPRQTSCEVRQANRLADLPEERHRED
jgi:hypothetical protein